MMHRDTPRSSLALGTTTLALAALLAGCAGTPRNQDTAMESIRVDGDTAEWAGGTWAYADEHALYLRFTVEDGALPLQSADRTIRVLVDCDASASTGWTPPGSPLNALGVDLEVQFSPPKDGGGLARGARVITHGPGGDQVLPVSALDVAVSPTYAASWYELRLSRTPSQPLPVPTPGLCSSGTITGAVVTTDASGAITGFTDPFEVQSEPVCVGGARLSDVRVPDPAPGAVRIVSYNVEKSAPAANPEPFRRVLEALHPDIVLVQEWDAGDAPAMEAWFGSLQGGGEWHVVKAPGDIASGGGVAVISRFPLSALPAGLMAGDGDARRSVRFAGAKVATPAGEVLVGSCHLKCCGTAESPEDKRRMAEARAINGLMRATAGASPHAVRVVGGDLNLVGSRPPLDLLRAELDADGSDLSVAAPEVLGDVTLTTWRDGQTEFPPGRLDYLNYSDANADIARAFVFDSSRFTDNALALMGVRRDDSKASDHLPVVIDLKPRP